jgi:hypothetical protein
VSLFTILNDTYSILCINLYASIFVSNVFNNSVQFNSCLFTGRLNSTEANYKVSTSIWKYTEIIKEQDTKHDSLNIDNKLIRIPIKNKVSKTGEKN